ncbi:MAG: hypothetical protein KDI06_12605 [Calditrichaeota bacterium]|nr:hypothetical protein [Calditrichota bacterium]HQU71689.1 ATP-binding protein [Calditrichia bacterium]
MRAIFRKKTRMLWGLLVLSTGLALHAQDFFADRYNLTPLASQIAYYGGELDLITLPDSLRSQVPWLLLKTGDIPVLRKTPGKFRHWLRYTLPGDYYRDPVLLLPPVDFSLEMYLGDSLIYYSGNMYPSGNNKFTYFKPAIVPLPRNYENKTLLISIFSQYDVRLSANDNIFLATGSQAKRVLFRIQLGDFIFGFLFLFTGMFSLLLFIRRFKSRPWYALSFGAFTVSIGLLLIFANAQETFQMPVLEYYLAWIGFFSFPIGLFSFLEMQIQSPYSWMIRRIWQIQLGFLIIAAALDFFEVLLASQLLQVSYFMLICYVIVTLVVGFHAAAKGDRQARMLIGGVLALGVLGSYDVLASMQMVPNLGGLFKYGTFAFIVFLIAILESRFSENSLQLRNYARELEEKSRALREANILLENQSANLEQQIRERTRDLDEKNRMVAGTLAELTDTQNQLVMREKMASLGGLVAGVAHEINTPIGAVNSSVQTVVTCLERVGKMLDKAVDIQELRGDPQFAKYLRLMETSNEVSVTAGKRIANIVRSLKNFARLDEADYQKVDLHEGIDSTLTLVHHELKRNVTVVREFGDLGPVPCYPNQMNQVFMNLFVNAAQAMEEKGTLTIITAREGDWARITIRDTGKGMPKSVMERIFESGFTTKKRGIGTGLGLAIVKKIIDDHRGTISVTSEEGIGTEFNIRLPMVYAPHKPENEDP